jgi:hypothetical protein
LNKLYLFDENTSRVTGDESVYAVAHWTGFDDELLTIWCLFLRHDAGMIECQNKQQMPDNSRNPSQLIE